jgi:PilZ domain
MSERRTVARSKSFLQGRLYYNHRQSSVDCLVRDLTENGARLRFSGAVATPDIVELHLPNKDETYRAHVIWRLGDEVGVCFGRIEAGQEEAPVVQTADLVGRVQTLETEVIALRRLLVELRSEVKRLRQVSAA